MKTVFLIVGESGCGKDTIVNRLEQYGYKQLKSYTTRSKRNKNEDTHIFITDKEYEQYKDNIVAYTYFNGYHYFSTKDQLYQNDLYIIDPDGIRYLKEKVEDIRFVIIYIKVKEFDRVQRMYKRGHNQDEVVSRLLNDLDKFQHKEYDYAVTNYDLDKAVEIVRKIIEVENN
jgi:guanylate kinase